VITDESNFKFFPISAPISKVIDYFRPNIPRILINRTIVHPKHSSDEENMYSPHDVIVKDFRDGYVFDAYLLGFCDDVTRVIGKLLFSNTPEQSSKDSLEDVNKTGKLLATLSEDNGEFNSKDWTATTNVPFERVFLFPGAQTPSKDDVSYNKNVEEPLYREVVYCDGCAERISGIVQKCVSCFDYDLCQSCYPTLLKTHYDGKHHFIAEAGSCGKS
jgi:Zinc finger, ZZ type